MITSIVLGTFVKAASMLNTVRDTLSRISHTILDSGSVFVYHVKPPTFDSVLYKHNLDTCSYAYSKRCLDDIDSNSFGSSYMKSFTKRHSLLDRFRYSVSYVLLMCMYGSPCKSLWSFHDRLDDESETIHGSTPYDVVVVDTFRNKKLHRYVCTPKDWIGWKGNIDPKDFKDVHKLAVDISIGPVSLGKHLRHVHVSDGIEFAHLTTFIRSIMKSQRTNMFLSCGYPYSILTNNLDELNLYDHETSVVDTLAPSSSLHVER